MGSGGTFVVPIHDLDTSGRDLRAPIPAAWLGGVLEGCELAPLGPDGSLDVHLAKMGRDVLVRGTVRVSLVIPCARCLDPVEMPRDLELSLLLAPASSSEDGAKRSHGRKAHGPAHAAGERKKREDEAEFSAEEADQDTYEGEEVVLDRFIREVVLLESPIFPLCSDACKGIRPPPTASGDESVSRAEEVRDPRLLPLLELFKKALIPKE